MLIRLLSIIIFIFSSVLSENLIAANVSYTAGVAYSAYENINLVEVSPGTETSSAVNAGVSMLEDDANFFTNINASFRSLNYINNIAADRNLGGLTAAVIWRLMPGRFEWYLNDRFTQTTIDTLLSDAPSNQQNINILSTGPDYTIRINSMNNLKVEARLENYAYEVNTDNNRAKLSSRWFYSFNSRLTIVLNDELESARYSDAAVNNDFDRNDVFISSSFVHGLNTLNMEYGYSNIKNSNFNDIKAGRYQFSLLNTRTQSSSVRFSYENRISDTGTLVARNIAPELGGNITNETAANGIFINKITKLKYLKALSKGNINFEIGTEGRDYRSLNLPDEKSKIALIRGLWNLKRGSNITYSMRIREKKFSSESLDREDKEKYYTIGYIHSLKRNMNLNFKVLSQERISTSENSSFEDLRVTLSFNYTSL